MSRGKEWLPHHTEILKRMTGFYGDRDVYSDREIAATVGHSERTIRRRRLDLGLDVCKPDWSKRKLESIKNAR